MEATGLEPLDYQWQFNGTDISAATSSSYTVIGAQAADAGSYTVVVADVQGSVTSDAAILTVNVPPFINTPPASQSASPGSNVAFSVQAGGTVPLSYQWRFNGSNLLGAVSSAYGITNAQTANTGTYDVIITNGYGSITSPPALLSVVWPLATLSGRVIQGASGLPGVKVSAGTNFSFSGAGGYYTNLKVPEGMNALVVPSLGGYAFAPSARSLVVVSNTSLPDFMAFPTLALAQVTNGAYQLTFAPGFTCKVQASTNLHDWQTVFSTNNVATNTLLLQFTDTNAANLPTRFYRVGQSLASKPTLTNWTATSHFVSLEGIAAPVLTCQIEASTNLVSWVTLFSSNLSDTAPFSFRYDDLTNSPVRFYRLSQSPGF